MDSAPGLEDYGRQASLLAISGDRASRRRQYWLAGGLACLLAGLGHVFTAESIIESTVGVFLLLDWLITMLA
ncbi:MAG: hypothetical protein WDZ49_15020, partial [Litorilinea sp.]